MRWWCVLLAALLVLGRGRAAYAQTTPRLVTDSSVVEVGTPFRVTLTVLVTAGGDPPQSPHLPAPAGATLAGPSTSTQTQVSIVGGHMQQSQGISATWSVTAARVGTLRLGPASVRVGGRTLRSNPTEVRVVPTGQAPQRGPRNPFGLLDPFHDPFPSFPGLPDPFASPDALDDSLPAYPDELATDRALDAHAFVRSMAVPREVVVGEQVTYRAIAYVRGRYREEVAIEPNHADFLAYPLIDSPLDVPTYRVPIGDEVWTARKVRELALFPVRKGTLRIGELRMGFQALGWGQRLQRVAAGVEVTVIEPPVAGRPAGYRLGDVGRFSLSATVEPPRVPAGNAISVVAVVRGSGNFPVKLRPPQQHGVEWLEPTVAEEIVARDGQVSGWRRFTYVVRLRQAGAIELGELTFPYWDPQSRRYDVARATLGQIEVLPEPGDASASTLDDDPLASLGTPRTTLGRPALSAPRWGDAPWYWALLFGMPFGVVVTSAAASVAQRTLARWRAQRSSLESLAARALADARRAARAGERAATASACERALIARLEAGVGLKVRGVLRPELAARLEAAGLPNELARAVVELLDAFDAERFAGAGSEAPAALVARTRTLLSRLRTPRRRAD